jgi:hypothetical protein
MQKSTRNLLIAVTIVLVLIAIASWWWMTKGMVKFTISQITPASGSAGSFAFTLTGSTSSKVSPASWVGKDIHVKAKSLSGSVLKSTVASATATSVTTAPIALASAFSYTPASGDHARIFIKE